MSFRAIKDGLFRTGSDDVPQMARVLGVLYLSGGALILLSLVLSHPEGAYLPGLYGIVGVGFAGGTGLILGARFARAWMIHAILAAGTIFICLATYAAGVGASVYSSMYVWVVLMSASFFSRPAVVAQVAIVVISWGVTLAALEESAGFSSTTRWIVGSLVLIVAAAVVSEIAAGRRAGEEERERLQLKLVHMAHHDPLTGVANRRLFEQDLPREMARAKRRSSSLCVLALDLDQFKAYNDEHGHVAGDRLLKSTASAWTVALRAGDLLARTGGDEFIALLPDCTPGEAEQVAGRLGQSVPLGQTCSTGIACWDGTESAETLLARADKAMYLAKSVRRGSVRTV